MDNAELIEALQTDIREVEDDPVNTLSLMWQAADALEAVDKRIAELERSFSDVCNANGSLACERNKLLNDVRELEAQVEMLKEESEAYKFGYLDGKTESDRQIEDLQTALTACRLRKDEAQIPKDGEWIEDEYSFIHCSKCGMEWDEPEHPQTNFCPNCGARMRS